MTTETPEATTDFAVLREEIKECWNLAERIQHVMRANQMLPDESMSQWTFPGTLSSLADQVTYLRGQFGAMAQAMDTMGLTNPDDMTTLTPKWRSGDVTHHVKNAMVFERAVIEIILCWINRVEWSRFRQHQRDYLKRYHPELPRDTDLHVRCSLNVLGELFGGDPYPLNENYSPNYRNNGLQNIIDEDIVDVSDNE